MVHCAGLETRLVDEAHYIDEVQCAAARVVRAIREHARKRDPVNNPNGIFDSFHIRRGDFQFKTTRVEAKEIYKVAKDELTPNSTIYIATDERNKHFFKDLDVHYDLLFMDDFKKELGGINTNYYGTLVLCYFLVLGSRLENAHVYLWQDVT
jgi:GDP-fucose protein O-fucosyltransferase